MILYEIFGRYSKYKIITFVMKIDIRLGPVGSSCIFGQFIEQTANEVELTIR